MITISEVKNRRQLKAFVKFPFSLYKDSDSWVPPIIKQEITTFDKKKNPVFKNADARFFLARQNGKIVGRVAAIINWLEVEGQGIKKMRFGWMDFIDELEVSKKLLETVREIGLKHGLDYMEGPIGFSNLDKVGVVTEGFDHLGSMITWYNHPYYAKHFEAHGFEVEKKYQESRFAFSNIKPEAFQKAANLIKRRYKVECIGFDSNRDILPYADDMFDVFIESHARLASFVNINQEQREYFKKKFIGFLCPEYVKFVLDENKKLIAFAIVTPSFARAIQKARGRLFPFGFRHLLHARKHNNIAVFYLIGILPEYQKKGLTAVIFDEFYEELKKREVVECISGPELEENTSIHMIWKNFNPQIFRRRCTFRKEL